MTPCSNPTAKRSSSAYFPRNLAVLGIALIASIGHAIDAVTFSVDPNQTSITFTGDVNGVLPITEQAPGSLTATGTGTIDTLLDPTQASPTSLVILPTSTMVGTPQPGPFLPGNQPAVIAGQVDLGGVTGYGTFRDVVLSIEIGPVAIDAAHEFSSLGMAVSITGLFDVLVPGVIDTTFSFFEFEFNNATAPGSIVLSGSVRVLTIPIDVSTSSSSSGLTLNLRLAGDIVATVPEPGTWTLMACACSAVIGGFVYRRKKS